MDKIDGLLKKGIGFEKQSMQGIGYKEFKAYYDKEMTLEECVEDVKKNSRHFAKRQYTFFNHQLNVNWFTDRDEAMKMIEGWMKNEV